MITIIDYKMGNLGSILNMLKKLGVEAQVASRPEDVFSAKKLILPGVGRFDAAMRNLKGLEFLPVLQQKVLEEKVPILGICVGMQIMTQHGEEGDEIGLGWVKARARHFRFPTESPLRIPHMGWNRLIIKNRHPMLSGLDENNRFYFAHSYYVEAEDRSIVLAESEYGVRFVAAFAQDNLHGVQFHPEKSHRFGMTVLRDFALKV